MDPNQKISRRDLFRGRFARKSIEKVVDHIANKVSHVQAVVSEVIDEPKNNQASQIAQRSAIKLIRPPGAIEESQFLEKCTRCEKCIQACPHDVIIHAPSRYRSAAGTPMIDLTKSPCLMCSDYPCIASCEDDALLDSQPKRIARAVIQKFDCIAQHSFCSACVEHCPEENAIQMVNGLPQIDDPHCTGCGICADVCLAPSKAIMMLPIDRASAPSKDQALPVLNHPGSNTHE